MTRAPHLALAGCVGLMLALSESAAPLTAADDVLIGIWSFKTSFGPAVSADVTVERKGSTWHATVPGSMATFQAATREVRFAFPECRGRFRGRLTEGGEVIEGFWIRPGVAADPRFPVG